MENPDSKCLFHIETKRHWYFSSASCIARACNKSSIEVRLCVSFGTSASKSGKIAELSKMFQIENEVIVGDDQ